MANFNDTRDNITDIEATIMEADKREREVGARLHVGRGAIEGSDKTGRETWDERCQRMAECDMTPVDMDNPREGVWQLTDEDIIRE
tara:strand:- start:892 stop:1149 length:258 start_codon:yes stop_codon:yes gene_type:complete